MKPGPIMRMVMRMLAGFVVATLLLTRFPEWWLDITAPVSEWLINGFCPFLTEMQVHAENKLIFAEGNIKLAMTMTNGEPVPLAPGTWNKQGGQTLNILIVAVAVWAAPIASIRRRLAILPVMLIAAAVASGFDLAVEVTDVTLRAIGQEWAPTLPLAKTPENIEVFRSLEKEYETVLKFKAFNDGGGRLFSGLLAGLIAFTVPSGLWKGRKGQTRHSDPDAKGAA